nr:hypothetical protein [Streptomyces flavotricini]
MSGQAPSIPIGIQGLGVHIPERRVSNADIADQYGVDPEWIERMTGVQQRQYAEPGPRRFPSSRIPPTGPRACCSQTVPVQWW